MSSGERYARVGKLELCYETFGLDTLAPLLLVMGLGAQMALWDDESCQALAAAIPSARLVIVPGMGHHTPPALWPRLIDEITANTSRATEPAPTA